MNIGKNKNRAKLAQTWAAIIPDRQIGMHFGTAHMNLSDFEYPTIPTVAFEQIGLICGTEEVPFTIVDI